MNPNWHGLIKIEEIQLVSPEGKILWEEHNLLNVLHIQGEAYILTAAFCDAADPNPSIVPINFYFGLDNRPTLSEDNVMSNLMGEPNNNGYERQIVAGKGQMILDSDSGHPVAKAPIVAFVANEGSWGPVSNLFLTNTADNTGLLIASIYLLSTITVEKGSTLNVRMGLGLRDYTV